MRAFVAVPLDAATRAAVAPAAEAHRAQAAGLAVSWVAPANLHLTVKFVGQVEDTRLQTVIDALHTAVQRHAAFAMDVDGLGAFPSMTRPRVLWAGVRAGGGALAALAASVDEALAPLGFAREDRPFSPHITVGRVREPRRSPALAEGLAAAATRPFGRVTVDEAALMRSDLSPHGARYTTLAALKLAP